MRITDENHGISVYEGGVLILLWRGDTAIAYRVPICGFHADLLQSFPKRYFDPPESMLSRRHVAEPALREILVEAENCRHCLNKGVAGTMHRILFRLSDVVTRADAIFSTLRVGTWQSDYLFDLKKKVLVLGDRAGEKERFLGPRVDGFDGWYRQSLGISVAVRRDRFKLPLEHAHWRLVNLMFNFQGEGQRRWRLLESYACGASAIIAACDVTIPSTVKGLGPWIDAAYQTIGRVPTVVLATMSKRSNVDREAVEDARAFAEDCGASFFGPTRFRQAAANRMFRILGSELVERTFGVRPSNGPALGGGGPL